MKNAVHSSSQRAVVRTCQKAILRGRWPKIKIAGLIAVFNLRAAHCLGSYPSERHNDS